MYENKAIWTINNTNVEKINTSKLIKWINVINKNVNRNWKITCKKTLTSGEKYSLKKCVKILNWIKNIIEGIKVQLIIYKFNAT